MSSTEVNSVGRQEGLGESLVVKITFATEVNSVERSNTDSDPNFDVFRSHRQHKDRFRLSETDQPAQVVLCIRQRQTIIVEDCIEASKQGSFYFFNEDQKGYLRSLLVYYLDEVCAPDGIMCKAALVIDTDTPNHFREVDRNLLEFYVREFAARIKLELMFHVILSTRSTTNENREP